MLERAGVERADLVVAVTGDDEDNIIVCQVAKEKYGVAKCIARVNDPRNQPHFDMVGIGLTVSATATILALIEHELPEHELVTLLDLRRENLEIVEFAIDDGLARGRPDGPRPEPSQKVAPDLGEPRQPRGDRDRRDRAPARRSRDGDPRARRRGGPEAGAHARRHARVAWPG